MASIKIIEKPKTVKMGSLNYESGKKRLDHLELGCCPGKIEIPIKMKYKQIVFNYKIGSVLRKIEGLTEKAMNEMVAHKLKDAMVEQLSGMDADRFLSYCIIKDTDIPTAVVSGSNFCYFEIPVE